MKHLFIFCMTVLSSNSQNTPLKDDGRAIKIPVVIHLVKKNNKHNVPIIVNKTRINLEMIALNNNFNAVNDMSTLNKYFIDENLIGNPNIMFELKEIIIHNKHKKGKKINLIDPSKNLNIIIGKYKYTVTPCSLNKNCTPNYVQINYNYFKGDNTQTATHEIGHWMGLYHVWGKSGKCKSAENPSDDISDTPIQYSCTKVSRNNLCPPVDLKVKPNYNNFMDYSACRCFFTKDQAKVMRSKIISYRRNIYDSSLINKNN